jgi:hypothetical protein
MSAVETYPPRRASTRGRARPPAVVVRSTALMPSTTRLASDSHALERVYLMHEPCLLRVLPAPLRLESQMTLLSTQRTQTHAPKTPTPGICVLSRGGRERFRGVRSERRPRGIVTLDSASMMLGVLTTAR